jgi:hypothetical protein
MAFIGKKLNVYGYVLLCILGGTTFVSWLETPLTDTSVFGLVSLVLLLALFFSGFDN